MVKDNAEGTCAEFDGLCSEYEVEKLLRKNDLKAPLPATVGALSRALPTSCKMYSGEGNKRTKVKAAPKKKRTPVDPAASYAKHKFVSLAYKKGKRQVEIVGAHANEAKEAGRLARKEAGTEWDAQPW